MAGQPYVISSGVPPVSDVWGDNVAPLFLTRDEVRNLLRRMLHVPVTLQGLGDLTINMNTTAELDVPAVRDIELGMKEWKDLETKKTEIQSTPNWEGTSAPMRKADVVEYDTELFHQGGNTSLTEMQTEGIQKRMAKIVSEIQTALNMNFTEGGNGYTPMFRS